MSHTLVVPLDGSRFAARAVPVAVALAQPLRAQVELVTTEWSGRSGSAKRYLDRVASSHPDATFLQRIVPGADAPAAIELAVLAASNGTVCMTSHGRGGLRWAALGSVAEEVVRRLDRPTVLVGRHAHVRNGKSNELLVCWDGSERSLASVPQFCEWANELSLSLHFVRVAHPLDRLARTEGVEALEHAITVAARGGLAVQRTLLTGAYFAGAISDFAAAQPVTMIAMATHARSGLERIGLSSVTMGVVGLAPVPVLVAHTAAADAGAARAV
jgi:nucleotide-binding universal stress UspA family protein